MVGINLDAPKRPALRYYGGGWTRAPWTLEHIPKHDHWFDAMFGGGSITIRKPMCQIEVANDINGRVVNFFDQLRNNVQELVLQINLTPWAEDEFNLCLVPSSNRLEDARRFFFLCWGSLYGGPLSTPSSFRVQNSVESRYSSPPMDAVDRFDLIESAQRLRNVHIFNRDIFDLLPKYIERV